MKPKTTQTKGRANSPNTTTAPRASQSSVLNPQHSAPSTQHSLQTSDSRLQTNSPGFTLPELLIAITIFISVAGGIALLFTQSIRTVKVGHQNIDISEEIRGAMDLIETDLTQAFTSRDYGDYYTFYGTPIGMTFVGLVRPNRQAAQPNLSRITYVLFGGSYAYDPEYGGGYKFTTYEDYANVPIKTYKLLRYVEPNQIDLDTFPGVDWPTLAQIDSGTVTVPEGYQTLYAELGQALQCAMPGTICGPTFENRTPNIEEQNYLCESGDLACREQIFNAKKRELWIRMLAGDPELPQFWADPNNPTDTRPDYRDYILAEDIVLTTAVSQGGNLTKNQIRILPDRQGQLFQMLESPAATLSYVYYYPPQTKLPGQLQPPATLPLHWPMRADADNDPYDITQRPFTPLFEFGACCAGGVPAFYPFWSDSRNMIGTESGAAEGNMAYATNPNTVAFGSPLAPRIPMMVNTNLSFLQKSPYAGAPDLLRSFTKQIDLPTGYTRTDLTG